MKKMLLVLYILLIMLISEGICGKDWFVDCSIRTLGNGTSPEAPLQTIQEAINLASDGDTVIVAEGTYTENIRFHGKNIVVRSSNPADPAVVQNTIIDGDQRRSVVTFVGTENSTCLLSGFTIRNGRADEGGGIHGGTWGRHTRATIRNNVISGNWAQLSGGGLFRCDGMIQNNAIAGNVVQSFWGFGGGLAYCHGIIEGNSITNNTSTGGGGLFRCDGIIRNNVIAGNSVDLIGGGADSCGGTIQNNTITANSAYRGGGVSGCVGAVSNCIVWGNTVAESAPQVYLCRSLTYCCIQNWTGAGEGNIADNPTFTDYVGGDYRLSDGSLCIDKGRNDAWMWQATDMDGNPRVLSGVNSLTVDIGAYEFVAELPAGETWYVDGGVVGSGDGSTWETAKRTIQEAMDTASDGDTVLVAPGTYSENISFDGRNVVLCSSDPSGEVAVSTTIIDGNQSGPVVAFVGTEDETCVLSGFTIRNGDADNGGGILGGTEKVRTRARIENNVIVSNSATVTGGGLAYCAGPILNTTICENQGGGLYRCSGTIRNCIIWGNAGAEQLDDQSSIPAYSCVEGWRYGGEQNIGFCPHFVDAPEGDYHLQSWSRCIDSGDPTFRYPDEPEPNGARVNMGAHGGTRQAARKSEDADGDGIPDDWEMKFFGHTDHGSSGDPDGDFISNMREYYSGSDPSFAQTPAPFSIWYVDASVDSSGDGTSTETAFKTIQEAIDAASHGDTVIVAAGSYVENIQLKAKNISLRSTDPLDRSVVEGTIIDGGNAGPSVTFYGTEDETCILSGFTIRNGHAEHGGGVCGGTFRQATNATVENNIVSANSADYGGGLCYCDGIIGRNTITLNSAGSGAGLFGCDGIVRNNTITKNTSTGALPIGGGLSACDGTIENNAVSENSANYGGGLHLCDAIIRCNTITKNSVAGFVPWGGGLYASNGALQNNTIVGNLADRGGGMRWFAGTIENCIIYGNTANHGPQIHESRDPMYSCIEGWGTGEGNISEDPQFEKDTYRLSQDSPCIDAGENWLWMRDAVDLDGNPRVWRGRDSWIVDMGAYEYGSFHFVIRAVAKGEAPGTELIWSSSPTDTYAIWSCRDLNAEDWAKEATVQSGGESTTWTDPDPSGTAKFYKVEMK